MFRCVWQWLLVGLVVSSGFGAKSSATPRRPPNIVLIFCDDLGWADLGCFGAKGIRTPNIDRLAKEGTKFTSFYVAQPVCSASRAALLTGCYPNRLGIHGALGPQSRTALNTNEWTIARALKTQGYATAIFGKWHLGRPAEFLPLQYGFDEYFGLPYSNDMWPNHPTAKPGSYPLLPLIEGDRVIETMPDQRLLTRRYTERAIQFIERQQAQQPFFLYLAHSMPHVPLFASDPFMGKSSAGLYGDVVEEIDWSVGQILETLARRGLKENTWVIFTSDNGPWHVYGNHAGSAGPFREGKASVFEGGVRVPCVMRWPGKIPAGRVADQPLMTIDLFPTLARQAGAPLPPQRIDGRDAWPLISGRPFARSPQEAYYFYYHQGDLQALRSGRWKLHLPHTALALNGKTPGRDGQLVPHDRIQMGVELYDLEADPGETRNLADRHPRTVRRLQRLADLARRDLGDAASKVTGSGLREPGRADRRLD